MIFSRTALRIVSLTTRRKVAYLDKEQGMGRDCIEQLAKTFKETTDYLVSEKCDG